ncbi:MAG: glycosyltransferase family 4 protein [Thermoleophilia bacterium]
MKAGHGTRVWLVVFTGNSGLTHYSYCLARALRAAGCDVTLVTNRNYDLGSMPADFPIIRLFRRSRYYPIDIIRFWRLYRRQRPEIIHYQSWLKFPALEIILLRLQKRHGTGLVCTAHDWLPHRKRSYHAFLLAAFYRVFYRIVVHTESGRGFLRDGLNVAADRIAVIPHGDYGFFLTDEGLTRETARQRLGLEADRFWFLFFGRVDPHKGLDAAIRALALMKPVRDNQEAGAATGVLPGLIVAGKPETGDMQTYEQLIDDLNLRDRVRLFTRHVPVPDIQLFFQAADAVVLPYRESSTSGILYLAMGFRKPVVACAVGGLQDTVIDGVTGILVPPGDDAALARAMDSVAGDSATRRKLAAGWSGIEAEHSWEAIAERTLDVYQEVAPASRPGGA